MNTKTFCVIYARQSFGSETESTSIDVQLEKCKEWANNIMQPLEDKLDGLDTNGASSKLGDLNFFRGRLPMDTGVVMDIKDAEGNVVKAFSFDNDLRYYDSTPTVISDINIGAAMPSDEAKLWIITDVYPASGNGITVSDAKPANGSMLWIIS